MNLIKWKINGIEITYKSSHLDGGYNMKCSICKEQIRPDPDGWNKGHNASPVNNGQCCGDCNSAVVLPMRLAKHFNSK